jgi:hypothetical protein
MHSPTKSSSKYNLVCFHKCGSTIIERILSNSASFISQDRTLVKPRIFTPISLTLSDKDVAVDIDMVKRLDWLPPYSGNDKFIFVVRNPLSIAISMFYSFAYTHSPLDSGFSEKDHLEKQLSIQKIGLNKFAGRRMNGLCKNLSKVFDDNEFQNKLILPYELMISNFSQFLHLFLNHINLPSLHQSIYEKHNKSFRPIRDRTDEIIKKGLKIHKRTTDINEWKKKFSTEEIEIFENDFPMVKKYQDFLLSHNL